MPKLACLHILADGLPALLQASRRRLPPPGLGWRGSVWRGAGIKTEMDQFCGLLADNPGMGRAYTAKHKTWLRMEHASHMVYYRKTATGLAVQRILHKSSLPDRHLVL